MSTKKSTAVETFEPSTGEESYLTDTPEQWERVNILWHDARGAAYQAIELFMDMGDLLLRLRDQMPGDLEFGRARKKYAPEISRNDAHRAMGMAHNRERFTLPSGNSTPSISVLAELVNASDELVDEVITETADPDIKSPTVKEVRQKVKAESIEDFEDQVSEKPDTVPDIEPEPILQDWFNMSTLARIKKFRKTKRQIDHEVAHLVIGLNPYYDGGVPLSPEVWLLVKHEMLTNLEALNLNGKEYDFFQDCIDVIQGDCYDA